MSTSSHKRETDEVLGRSSWQKMGGDNIWLPYTQMKTASEPLQVVATDGCHLGLSNRMTLLDGVASWWTACHGYNHPHIAKALKQQIDLMPHVMFGGLNHEPALRLAKRLAALAPGDLSRVFFADSGSVAVEVALKMATQYWINRGEQGRTKFLGFRNAYHGDTMACMSLCDPDEGMHAHFGGYLPQQMMAELPCDDLSAAAFEAMLMQKELAAVILEPLVQGAGGMKFHEAATVRRVAELCSRHDVLLIADEIFTGFGRTGSMFACEEAGIVPDILCLGKALTGGVLTLAATLARPHVFEAFWSDDPDKALMHGPTYMANPLACAAANASLDLFEIEPRLERVRALESQMKEELDSCRDLPGVVDVRVKGAIGVVQLDAPCDLKRLTKEFLASGVWLRPFRDVITLTPAFTMLDHELSLLTEAVYAACAVGASVRSR